MKMLPEDAREVLMPKSAGQTCQCGHLLIPAHNSSGKRIGVTHATVEEDDDHNRWFAGLRVETPHDHQEAGR